MESLQSIGIIFDVRFLEDDSKEIYIYIDLERNCMVHDQCVIIANEEKCIEFTIINVGLGPNENLYAVAKSNNISEFLGMDVQSYHRNSEDKSLLKSLIGKCPLKYYYIRRIK